MKAGGFIAEPDENRSPVIVLKSRRNEKVAPIGLRELERVFELVDGRWFNVDRIPGVADALENAKANSGLEF